MLGYDYEVIYKKGCDNVVDDVLSHQFEDEGNLLSLSLPIPDWIEVAHHEWFSHPSMSQLINRLREYHNSSKDYSWKDEVLHYKVLGSVIPNLHPQNLHLGRATLLSSWRTFKILEELCMSMSLFLLNRHEARHSYFCS